MEPLLIMLSEALVFELRFSLTRFAFADENVRAHCLTVKILFPLIGQYAADLRRWAADNKPIALTSIFYGFIIPIPLLFVETITL
jgi:hypothetical protein